MIMFSSDGHTITLPTKGSPLAAGYDIYSPIDVVIYPQGMCFIETHLHVKLPIGWFGLLKERSGLAKKGLSVLGGVIDCDYIDNTIGVVLCNHGDNPIELHDGDRFCQLIPIPTLINTPNELDRNGGFGSTGK